MPPNALPEDDRLGEALGEADGREPEAEGVGRDAPVEGAGRLAEGVPVEGRAPTAPVEGRPAAVPVEGRPAAVPVDGRALLLPVEGRAPVEPQPRAAVPRADAEALGEPLLLNRLWSGCHFFWPDAVDRAVVLALVFLLPSRLTLRLTFLSMSMSTSPP